MYSPKFYVGFLSYKLYNYIDYIAEIILMRITVTPKNTGKTFINIFLIITIIFYGYFLLKVTLFKGGLYGMEATGIRSLNLDPFIGWDKGNPFTCDIIKGHEKAEFYANLFLFIPVGIIFRTLFKGGKALLKSVVCAFLISFFIEISQYIFAFGITDIDDIILNTAGGFIGALIFLLMEKVLGYETSKGIVAVGGSIITAMVLFVFFIEFIEKISFRL